MDFRGFFVVIAILQVILIIPESQAKARFSSKRFRQELPDSLGKISDEAVAFIITGNAKINLAKNATNAVLVVGNTGAGKTTLSMFLTGQKLLAHKKRSRYLITDNADKISTVSTMSSKTIHPEIYQDTATYYDLPAFSNARNISTELAHAWFIRIITGHVEQVKILCVINFSSLKVGESRTDFKSFLDHMIAFIPEAGKFRSSIGLVASKVDNYVEDQVVIEIIVEFLTNFKNDINEVFRNDEEKAAKATEIVDTFLHQDSAGNYDRIGFFKQPSQAGEFDNLPYFVERRNNLKAMVDNNLEFAFTNEDDLGADISETAEPYVQNVAEKLYEKFSSLMESLASQMLTDFPIEASLAAQLERMENKFEDILNRREFMQTLLEELGGLASFNLTLKEIFLLDKTVQFFENIGPRQQVEPQISQWRQILHNAIEQLKTLVPKVTPPSMTQIDDEIQQFLESIKIVFISSLVNASSQDFETQSAFKGEAGRNFQSLMMLSSLLSSAAPLNTFINVLNATAATFSFSPFLPSLQIALLPDESPEHKFMMDSWSKMILESTLQITLKLWRFMMNLQKLDYESKIAVLNNNIEMLQFELEQQSSINQTESSTLNMNYNNEFTESTEGPTMEASTIRSLLNETMGHD